MDGSILLFPEHHIWWLLSTPAFILYMYIDKKTLLLSSLIDKKTRHIVRGVSDYKKEFRQTQPEFNDKKVDELFKYIFKFSMENRHRMDAKPNRVDINYFVRKAILETSFCDEYKKTQIGEDLREFIFAYNVKLSPYQELKYGNKEENTNRNI